MVQERRGTKAHPGLRATKPRTRTWAQLKRARARVNSRITLSNLNVHSAPKLPREPRHWICYHNSDRMGFSLDVNPISVQTNKNLRGDGMIGDWIWVISKRLRVNSFFMHCPFIVAKSRHRRRTSIQKSLELSSRAKPAWRFRRKVRLDGMSWFERYKTQMRGLSHGLQRISDGAIRDALFALAEKHWARAATR
jgi:hypothetical protein